jgi:hypothetical protein
VWNALFFILLLIPSQWGLPDRPAFGRGRWGRGNIAATPLPTDITDLKIWLEADTGITMNESNLVSGWVDRQGYVTVAQTLTQRPLWVASVPLANNQPGVQFDGEDDFMHGDMVDITAPYTIILIATEPKVEGDYKTLYEFTNHHGEVPYLYMATGGYYRFLDNNVGWNIEGGPLASWMMICPSGAMKGYKNGILEGEGTATTLDLIGLILCGCSEWTDWADMTVMCFLVYNHALTNDEITILNAYLIPKFGMGI